MPVVTVSRLIHQGKQKLLSTSDSPLLDAEVLFRYIKNWSTLDLIRQSEETVSAENEHRFWHLIEERRQGRPIAYLVKKQEFWSMDFSVNDSTLIPRADTETLIERAINLIQHQPNANILDLGTGSGNIAISIALECPSTTLIAVDRSSAALELAKHNARKLLANNITFIQSNWFENLSGKTFDFILSNPPYIAINDPHLDQGDVRFEPHSALVSGVDGLTDIRHITKHSKNFLKPNGRIMMEHGADQGISVRTILQAEGFSHCQTIADLGHNERVSHAQLLAAH